MSLDAPMAGAAQTPIGFAALTIGVLPLTLIVLNPLSFRSNKIFSGFFETYFQLGVYAVFTPEMDHWAPNCSWSIKCYKQTEGHT